MPSMKEACAMIRADMEADVKRLDHAPFSGSTVGEMHGSLSAAVSALAGMIAILDERIDFLTNRTSHL